MNIRASAPWVLCAAVALAASISGIRNALVLDDALVITEDARVQDPSQWGRIATEAYWAPPVEADLYRPLTTLGLAVQNLVGGGSPVVFRVVSYLLYAGAALVFLAFARRLLPASIAFMTALLFAAHPVHVEAVAAAVSQNEIVVAMLTMVAVMMYVARRTSEQGMQPQDWLGLAGLYVAAALFKEQGLMLPGFLLLAELFMVPPGDRAKIHSVWKGYVALGIVMIALLAVRWVVLQDRAIAPSPRHGLEDADFAARALTGLKLIPEWLRLLAWPQHLRVDYSPQELMVSTGLGARERLGLGLLIITIAIVIGTWRRRPIVCFAIGWFALALLPVSNVLVPTGILVAERTLFLPSVGFMLLVGAAAAFVRERWSSPRLRIAATVAASALVVLGVWRSAFRHPVWGSRTALAASLVKDSPRSWWAHWFAAEELFKQGRIAEARAGYERSIGLAIQPWWVQNDYAKRLRQIGDEESALVHLDASLRKYPRQKEPIFQYVAALIALGRYELASDMARHVLEFPDAPPQMFMLLAAAERARETRAPAGSIRLGVPKDSGGPTLHREQRQR